MVVTMDFRKVQSTVKDEGLKLLSARDLAEGLP